MSKQKKPAPEKSALANDTPVSSKGGAKKKQKASVAVTETKNLEKAAADLELSELSAFTPVERSLTPAVESNRLFAFPTTNSDNEARQKWKSLVNRLGPNGKLWSPSKDCRVCSRHFIDGKPTPDHPYPTIALGYQDATRRTKRILFAEDTGPAKKSKRNPGAAASALHSPDPDTPDLCQTQGQWLPSVINVGVNSLISLLILLQTFCLMFLDVCKRCAYLHGRVNVLTAVISRERKQSAYINQHIKKLTNSRCHDISTTLLKTDKDVLFYTGVLNKRLFSEILGLVQPFIKRRWRGKVSVLGKVRHCKQTRSRTRLLSARDELLLTLMKLRLGLLMQDLATRFEISIALCSQIFFCWLRGLSLVLSNMIFMPDMGQVRASKPARFHHLPDIHSIIDCTEIFIETPKDMVLQNATWSSYKHHNTVKILICISPNGAIIFRSKAFAGRVQDKELTLVSQFLDQVPPYSQVMADKGFNIEKECADRCLSLHVPPGRRGVSQMSSAGVAKTKRIANLRILVEQVIREIKTFKIIQNELPLTLIPHVDDIVTVICALVNFRKPLY